MQMYLHWAFVLASKVTALALKEQQSLKSVLEEK